MENKITIDGIDCLISSGVHQSTGDIFFRKDPNGEKHYVYEMFTEDEARKIIDYLTSKNWSANCSSSTYFAGWGRRVSLVSVYMGQDAIQEAFVDYYNKQINK